MAINGGNSALASDSPVHRYLYHGTPSRNVKSIKESGLKPKDGHNYVSTEPLSAGEEASVRKGPISLIALHRHHPSIKGSLEIDPDQKEPGVSTGYTHFRTKNHIPPDAISHVVTKGRNKETNNFHKEQTKVNENRYGHLSSLKSSENSHSNEE